MNLTAAPGGDAADIKNAIDGFVRAGRGCLAVLPDGRLLSFRNVFLALALEHRLPAIYPFRYVVHEGGMMSYGIDPVDVIRQTATYVDRILRGASPAELPVQNPTKLALAINLKTAKAIGFEIPETLLLPAAQRTQ